MTDTTRSIRINRAPVLALWAAVVAQRLGHGRDAALTLGQALADLNAHSRASDSASTRDTGRRLRRCTRRAPAKKGVTEVDCSAWIPAVETPDGLTRAQQGSTHFT
jgi:hypothetical protein